MQNPLEGWALKDPGQDGVQEVITIHLVARQTYSQLPPSLIIVGHLLI